MTMRYPNPSLEAELAYRRDLLLRSGRRADRRPWALRRRDS